MYHSQLGRFCSRDLIGYAGSPNNLLEYAASSPTLHLDPTGEVIETIPDIICTCVDAKNAVCDPSWENVGWFCWSAGACLLPGVPGSYCGKAAKYGKKICRVRRAVMPMPVLGPVPAPQPGTNHGIDPILKKKSCFTEYPSWPVCPRNMYQDRHIACVECNKAGFRPDNEQITMSPHFWGPASHWTCLAPGKGPRSERRGVSIICGSCCQENAGHPTLDNGCICARSRDNH